MKKHSMRRSGTGKVVSEAEFAKDLVVGERFAISEGTTFSHINAGLRERGMCARPIHRSELTHTERRHWGVYEVMDDPQKGE